jgi:hypothetical protein
MHAKTVNSQVNTRSATMMASRWFASAMLALLLLSAVTACGQQSTPGGLASRHNASPSSPIGGSRPTYR